MTLTWLSYFLGVCSAFLAGFSKTGLPGVSIPAILLMTEACPTDARASVAAILPVLLVGDLFAVAWFHHHANWPRLWRLFPWVLAGMIPGVAVLEFLDGNRLRPWMGWLVMAMLGIELWRRWREWKILKLRAISPTRSTPSELKVVCVNCELYGLSPCEDCIKLAITQTNPSFPRSGVGTQFLDAPASKEVLTDIEVSTCTLDAIASQNCVPTAERGNEGDSPRPLGEGPGVRAETPATQLELFPHAPWFVAMTGFLAGFSTFVANAAMPVMSVYLISQGFNKREFLGTAAWFFFLLNLSKVPVYGGMGMFRPWMLPFDLWLVIPVLLGCLFGVLILRYIPQKTFNALALLLAGVAAMRLILV